MGGLLYFFSSFGGGGMCSVFFSHLFVSFIFLLHFLWDGMLCWVMMERDFAGRGGRVPLGGVVGLCGLYVRHRFGNWLSTFTAAHTLCDETQRSLVSLPSFLSFFLRAPSPIVPFRFILYGFGLYVPVLKTQAVVTLEVRPDHHPQQRGRRRWRRRRRWRWLRRRQHR